MGVGSLFEVKKKFKILQLLVVITQLSKYTKAIEFVPLKW